MDILYENRSPHQIDPKLTDYCDIHDLIAVVSIPTQKVLAYRINGQVAFTIDRKDPESSVSALKFKPDGSLLAVGWSDGTCGVYSGEDGKLLNQIDGGDQQDDENDGPVSCIGWTSYPSRRNEAALLSEQLDAGLSATEKDRDGRAFVSSSDTASILHPGPNGSSQAENNRSIAESISELTRSISTIDVTNVLPRLSALPAHQLRARANEQKYTTQTGIDTLLDTNRLASNTISTLITSGTSGVTSVYLDDSVKLGSFNMHGQPSSSVHAANQASKSEVILSATENDPLYRLHYIDLPLETLSGTLLQVAAANTKRIQTLVGYINQTVHCIQSDFTANLQLPTRLIGNITEELSEKNEGDLVTNLYDLAMTGTFTSTMLEWLADTIKENTHKRWEKNINDMYNHIQTHILVNLVPALDRLAIATNAIRGHAQFHEDTDKFVPPQPLTALMDDIDAVRLLAQKLSLIIMTEHRQFRAFSKWMRVMIEIGVAGPGSKAATEIEEREVPNLDDSLVLAYVQDTLNRSRLTAHLEQRPLPTEESLDNGDSPNVAEIGRRDRENVLEALKKLDSLKGDNAEDVASALNLSSLVARLIFRSSLAIRSIDKWQSRMLSEPSITSHPGISAGPNVTISDLKMFPPERWRAENDTITNILVNSLSGQGNHNMSLYKVFRLHSGECEFSHAHYELPSGVLLHTKLLSESNVLLLFKNADDGLYSLLLCDLADYETQNSQWIKVLHSFDPSFAPGYFVIGGREGKRVCLVFSINERDWKVLDLSGSGRASRAIS